MREIKCKICGASHYSVIITEYIEVENNTIVDRIRTVTEVVCEECLSEIHVPEEVKREYEDRSG